jgi:hypothetical protein
VAADVSLQVMHLAKRRAGDLPSRSHSLNQHRSCLNKRRNDIEHELSVGISKTKSESWDEKLEQRGVISKPLNQNPWPNKISIHHEAHRSWDAQRRSPCNTVTQHKAEWRAIDKDTRRCTTSQLNTYP